MAVPAGQPARANQPVGLAPMPQSFPSGSILDDFNRSDGAIGSNWSGDTSGYSIASNQLDVGTGGEIYWSAASSGADQEVFVTLTNVDANSTEQGLLLKSQSSSGYSSGVIEVQYDAVGSRVQVWTYSSGQGWVQRGADISVTFASSDQFRARAKANGTVEVYRNGVLLATRDVSDWPDYANSGYIGLWFTGASDATLDDLGGGTVQIPLTAAFSASPVTGAVPLTVTFTNQSTPASAITGYLWAFGDGYTATITSPVHSYTSAGYYTVTLAAMAGAEQNTITKTNYITVSAASAPTVAFTASPVTGTVPLTVTFTNQSSPTQTITSYLWTFGDGSTSTITNPEHTYTATGYYTVALTAYAGAAQDTITKTNYITATSGGSAATLLTTTIGYTYDPLQRLTGATASGATTYTFAYAYDAVGNRTAQTQTITNTLVTNYIYDAANRLTSVNGQAYTWDANGNLLNDGSKVYTYTQANRLVTITQSGLSWSATYNGDGARLKQTVNSMDTSYTLDLATPLVQVLVQQDAGSKTAYLYGVRRVGEQQPSGWAYHLTDALGSVRQLADASAQVALAQGYMPYGEGLWSLGNGSSAYGYTGEDWNVTTQLLFLRARYYAPGAGRFIQRDTWGGNYLRPQSIHLYIYVRNDPINLTDPTGRIPSPSPWPFPECPQRGSTCDSAVIDLTQTDTQCVGRECSKKVAAGFGKNGVLKGDFHDKCALVQWVRGTMMVDGNKLSYVGTNCDPKSHAGCQTLSSVNWRVDMFPGESAEYPSLFEFMTMDGTYLESLGYILPKALPELATVYMIDRPFIRGEPGQTIEAHIEFIDAIYDRPDIAKLRGDMVGNPQSNPSPHVTKGWKFDAGPYTVPECYSSLLTSFMVGLMAVLVLVPSGFQVIIRKRRTKRALSKNNSIADN